MKPLRMCMVCRKRMEKHQLIRIAKSPSGEIAIDLDGKQPGRGAYLCRNRDCLEKAQKRRALERAFSGRIAPELYAALCAALEVAEDES